MDIYIIIGLCHELITRPEESYRLWLVVVCDLENLVKEKPLAHLGGGGFCAKRKNIHLSVYIYELNYVYFKY
jgi:hypothetical protein